MAYATTADVVEALDLDPDGTVSQAAEVADANLNVSLAGSRPSRPGRTLQVGEGELAELVTVLDAGPPFTVTPLAIAHAAGTALWDVTKFVRRLEDASRQVDDETLGAPRWLEFGEVQESRRATVTRDGQIVFTLTKATVVDLLAVSYTRDGLSSPTDLDVAAIVPADRVLKAWLTVDALRPGSTLQVDAHYTGGYVVAGEGANLPEDIRRATATLVARMWKQKDSGFSDVIGDAGTGILGYTKAMPADVKAMLSQHKRTW